MCTDISTKNFSFYESDCYITKSENIIIYDIIAVIRERN